MLSTTRTGLLLVLLWKALFPVFLADASSLRSRRRRQETNREYYYRFPSYSFTCKSVRCKFRVQHYNTRTGVAYNHDHEGWVGYGKSVGFSTPINMGYRSRWEVWWVDSGDVVAAVIGEGGKFAEGHTSGQFHCDGSAKGGGIRDRYVVEGVTGGRVISTWKTVAAHSYSCTVRENTVSVLIGGGGNVGDWCNTQCQSRNWRERCVTDSSCANGGLGCNALGYEFCRYCGFGHFNRC